MIRATIRDPAGARTQDPILKRDVLYLLSYWILNIILIIQLAWLKIGSAKLQKKTNIQYLG